MPADDKQVKSNLDEALKKHLESLKTGPNIADRAEELDQESDKACKVFLSMQTDSHQWENNLEATFNAQAGQVILFRKEPSFLLALPVTYFQDLKMKEDKEKAASAGKMDVGMTNLNVFYGHLETNNFTFAFRLFSNGDVYTFNANNSAQKEKFLESVSSWCTKYYTEEEISSREKALESIQVLLADQYMSKIEKYKSLQQKLVETGLFESSDTNILASGVKERWGNLGLESQQSATGWRDYYCVLLEGALYWFEKSDNPEPAGFVVLRNVVISFDQESLSHDECVFTLSTPLRTVCFKAKHAVALAEWISSLETALNVNAATGGVAVRTSAEILDEIFNEMTPRAKFNAFLKLKPVPTEFDEQLDELQKRQLKFLRKLNKARKKQKNDKELGEALYELWNRFFRKGKNVLTNGPRVRPNKATPDIKAFFPAAVAARESVWPKYQEFTQTQAFKTIEETLDVNVMKHIILRNPDPFDCFLKLIITIEGQKKEKVVALKRSQKHDAANKKEEIGEHAPAVVKIGREDSNDVVIAADSKMSRSHGKLIFTKSWCTFEDAGSARGSKVILNQGGGEKDEKKCIWTSLIPGDILLLGTTRLELAKCKDKKEWDKLNMC